MMGFAKLNPSYGVSLSPLGERAGVRGNNAVISPPQTRSYNACHTNPTRETAMLRPILHLILLLALAAPVLTAHAAPPPTDPLLRIETGMHTAPINRIGVDAAGRWLLTASDDKTARLWDLQTGRLLHTYRPPIGAGDEGKLYAGALSPDGRWVAVGGWTGYEWDKSNTVYLFDRASGRLQQRLTGLPGRAMHLAFSPDSTWLAAGLGGNNGIRLWRADQGGWTAAGEDRDYGADVYGLDFSAVGNRLRLAASSWDGDLRLYRVEQDRAEGGLQRLARERAPGGRQPFALRFSPDGRRLAVGYDDQARVDVLDAEDLTLDFTPDLAGVSGGNLGRVAWAGAGERAAASSNRGLSLLAGGKWGNPDSPLRAWPDAGRGSGQTWPAGQNSLTDLAPVRVGPLAGATAWGAADPAWGVLDAQGQTRLHLRPAIADLRGSLAGFQISTDGRRVRFGYESGGKSPAQFDLAERRFFPADGNSPLAAPRTTGLDIQGWKDTRTPTLAGQPLKLEPYEPSRSLAIAADARRFVLGTAWLLRLFDAQGTEQWQQPVPGAVWGVNLPADQPLVVAAYGDGTIRWHRLSDGQELLAFFPHADKKRWVMWTPSGYFDASPGAEDLIGWHVNNGQDAAADFYPASRFRARFHRPDVIDRVLTTLDEAEALRQADAEAGRRTQQVNLLQTLPPVARIVSPGEGERFSQTRVTLRYSVRTAADAPVTGIKVLLDGRPLESQRGLQPKRAAGEQEYSLDLSLPQRDVTLALIAENRHGASVEASVRLTWAGAKPQEFVAKPRLYVLAVGVSNYQDASLKLHYPAKDARDFATALQKQQGLYREVVVKLLPDATADQVLDGLDWLRSEVTAKDVGMLFLAGHGVNDADGDYYFLPANANPERLRRTAVAYFDVKKTLSSLPGKTLAFIDTCHSGNVMGARRGVADINAVINDLTAAENGVVVFASSTGRQFSLEKDEWNNGAFTKALVEGLTGKADYTGDGAISINELDTWLADRVKKLTGNQQTPTTTKPNSVPDFPLAAVR